MQHYSNSDAPTQIHVVDTFRYEVKYTNGMDCGGSYMKLLSDLPGLDLVSSSLVFAQFNLLLKL